MHPAIELLLARMESNPEEFVNTINGRWGKILTKVSEAAPEQDWELIKAKLKTVRLDVLHKQIMQELCAPDSPEQLEFDFGTPKIIAPKNMFAQATALLNGHSDVNK